MHHMLMPSINATEKFPMPLSRVSDTMTAPRPLPKQLLDLRPGQCHFCVADTVPGAMDRALFCAAPIVETPYCPEHTQVCQLPGRIDVEAVAAEIESALNPDPLI